MSKRLTEINQINKIARLELVAKRSGETDLRIANYRQMQSSLTQRFAFKSSPIL